MMHMEIDSHKGNHVEIGGFDGPEQFVNEVVLAVALPLAIIRKDAEPEAMQALIARLAEQLLIVFKNPEALEALGEPTIEEKR